MGVDHGVWGRPNPVSRNPEEHGDITPISEKGRYPQLYKSRGRAEPRRGRNGVLKEISPANSSLKARGEN